VSTRAKVSKDRWALLKQPRTWIVLGSLVLCIFILVKLGLDTRIVAAIALLAGLLTHAFSIILGVIALVPVIGPVIVGLLSLPIFWFINATSHVITALAVKQGYGKDLARSKLLVVMLMIGMILGFLIGTWTS
jgi:hypothetical protein